MVFIYLFEPRPGYYIMQKETGTNALCPCFEMSATHLELRLMVLSDGYGEIAGSSAYGTLLPKITAIQASGGFLES